LRFVKSKFKHGSINSSVFSLVQVILGAGILTFPYAFMQNGLIFTVILLSISATISIYTGILLIQASDLSGKSKYEDIAHVLFGRTFGIITTVLILMALLASNISYTVYVRYFSSEEVVANGNAQYHWTFHGHQRSPKLYGANLKWPQVLGSNNCILGYLPDFATADSEFFEVRFSFWSILRNLPRNCSLYNILG
jgi:Transmembrane amino acid transporter protein